MSTAKNWEVHHVHLFPFEVDSVQEPRQFRSANFRSFSVLFLLELHFVSSCSKLDCVAVFVFSPQQNAHTQKTDSFGVPCSLAYLRLLWRGRRSPPSCCLCQLFSKTFSTRPNLQRWPIWSKKKTCTKKRQNCATQKEVKNIKEQTLRDAQTAEEICFLPVSSGHMARCLTILPTAQHNKRLQHPLLHLASSAWFLHNIAYIALWLSYIFFLELLNMLLAEPPIHPLQPCQRVQRLRSCLAPERKGTRSPFVSLYYQNIEHMTSQKLSHFQELNDAHSHFIW